MCLMINLFVMIIIYSVVYEDSRVDVCEQYDG